VNAGFIAEFFDGQTFSSGMFAGAAFAIFAMPLLFTLSAYTGLITSG
jgi:hypothetical protein